MIADFALRAFAAFVMIAAIASPLGSVAVWRRMSYFGDATSHAALLGVAIAIVVGANPLWGGVGMAIIMGLYLGSLSESETSSDAILGVIAHGGLALALLIGASSSKLRGSFEGYLFGDILSTSTAELVTVFCTSALVLILLALNWTRILVVTLNRELASAQNINPKRTTQLYVLLLAITVALAMKVVGALLVGALLVIPAISARPFAKTPEAMVMIAFGFSFCAGLVGFMLSFQYDLPTGPSIVTSAFGIFLIGRLVAVLRRA